MEAELAKIHVPLLYTRIFAIGHLLLSISNFRQLTKGKILRLSSRMEASRRSGHGQLVAVDLSPSLSIQNFPPFYGGGNFERLIVDGAPLRRVTGNLLPST